MLLHVITIYLMKMRKIIKTENCIKKPIGCGIMLEYNNYWRWVFMIRNSNMLRKKLLEKFLKKYSITRFQFI